MARFVAALVFALVLTGCASDETSTPGEGAGGDDPAAEVTSDSSDDGDQAGADGGGDAGAAEANSEASAALVVGDRTVEWSGNEWTLCDIGGMFPASAEFQIEEVKSEGDWFQFIDRGDGSVNFSVVLDGEEYGGTGPGEADEIRDDGFAYTGTLNRGGEVLDTTLDVTC